jgi:hypothetical protein
MNQHLLLLFFITAFCSAQNSPFPFRESFDALPSLPAGWTTSFNKNPSGDFSVTSSSARSAPNAVSSSDATRPQFLIIPPFDLTGRTVDSLEFYERRSSTHQARVLVEAAIGNDTLFGIRISPDSLRFVSSSSYVRRAFVLPETLSGRASVRIRIRIIADTAGTTGVYRLDDVRLTVKKNIDLGLTSLTVLPSIPRQGETVIFSVQTKNRAAAGIFSGKIKLFDSLSLITEESFQADIEANDSQSILLQYPTITAGRHPIRIELQCAGDEDTSNNIASTIITAGYKDRTLLINEFMFLPTPGMPEWIELINPSADTISLAGWKVSDGGSTKAPLLSSSAVIPPATYCVITTDTSVFKDYFPAHRHLVQASFSSLNNSGDAVVLFDQTLSVIDSLSYLASWGGAVGHSLERIDTAEGSTLRTNWRTSIHPDGGTPGMINSVTPKQYDAAVERMTFIPNLPKAGEEFSAVITIRNAGREKISNAVIRISLDHDLDSLLTEDELLRSAQLSAIERNDSILFSMTIPGQPQGPCRIAAEVIYSDDDEQANDLFMFTLMIGAGLNSIVINEIMAAPSGDIPEWIEGFNRSADTVRIDGWKISDNGTTKALLTGGRMLIPPQELFVVTTDTMQFLTVYPQTAILYQASFSGLNNTTPDAVVLYDDRNEVMDSIFYRPSWGVNGSASLQRYDTEQFGSDSANWRSAVPTPGSVNSIARKRMDAELHRVTVERTTEGLALRATVRNIGREPITGAFVRMELPESIDEDLSSLPLPALAPYETSAVSFAWKTDRHGTARVTIRGVVPADERMENDTAVISAAFPFPRQSMVINEILYEPLSGDAEFVELMNRSPDTLDAEGWKLLDQPGSTGSRAVMLLSDTVLKIPPNGFLVIASDSSFLTRYPEADRKRTVIHPSLSLSNSGEDLVLADLTGTGIDSVRYSPQWHLRSVPSAGRSLERINPGLPSNDGKNWSSSASRNGATPHVSNSIYTAAVSTHSSTTLSPNPFSPDNDGHEDFLSINYSLPAASSMIRIRIYDVTGRQIRRLVQNEPSGSTGSVLWNGLDDDGRRVRIGMYIILLEALDNFGGTVRTMKDVAVVARRL